VLGERDDSGRGSKVAAAQNDEAIVGSRTRQMRKDATVRALVPKRFTCPVCDEQRLLAVSKPEAGAEIWTRCPCGYETRIVADEPRSRWRCYGSHDHLVPTLRDLETGETAKAEHDASLYWWSEGNGGCDCNRSGAFGGDDNDDEAVCCGSHRYIVIDVEGDITDEEKPAAIARMNESYSEAIEKHGGEA
jgi:hypothetical protein